MNRAKPAAGRSLTPLYCLHQAVYFFAMSGVGAFSVTYLTGRGFDAAQTGVMLASSNILSCVLQPAIGSYVDKTSVARLQTIIPACLIASFAMLGSSEWLALPQLLAGILYILGYLSFSITIPLCNSLCAYYTRRGLKVNYGAGAGVGSLSFSFGSLAFGYIIAGMGMRAMICVALVCLVLQFILVRCYPKIDPGERCAEDAAAQSSLSMLAFFKRYRMFMLTMLGVVCLAACHAMAENFLIQIFDRIGGGSENVGMTLFLACITAAPAQIYFEQLQRRISVVTLLRICGLFYIAKALLLITATTVTAVYIIGLLQMFTYGFLSPPLYYLVLQRIAPQDMAKGQTLASGVFSLGLALGNSLGGAAIESLGLSAMLAIAAGIALVGTLLINFAIIKPDLQKQM